MKILIVDDHAIFRRIIRSMLDKSVPVVEAGDGEEGLTVMKANADINIVFTDYNMPKKNGLEMLEAMRRDIPTFKPHVVFISSERDKTLAEKAKTLGVNHWLPKPFKKEEFEAILKQMT